MKKLVLVINLTLIVCLLNAYLNTVQAKNNLPGESVYASPKRQKEIAAMIDKDSLERLKRAECCILVESITPVYYINPLDFLESGKWKLYPSTDYPIFEGADNVELYVAKAIDYQGLNAYDVSIRVYNSNKIATIILNDKIKYGGWSRTSYADHKERIRSALYQYGMDEELSDDNVRYVIIMGIETTGLEENSFNYGSAFYISCGDNEALVNLDAFDGLFYEVPGEYRMKAHILTGSKAVERFTELKEKRYSELKYKQLSEKMGIDTSKWDLEFKKQYTDNVGNTYDKFSQIYHILHISDYLERNKFILMTKYPKQEKLIGTRYAVIEENTEPKDTEQTPESEEITTSNQKAQQSNKIYIVVGNIFILSGVIILCVFFYKKR